MTLRQEKFNSLLKNLISSFLCKELDKNCVMTITRVETPKDFKTAKIFISIFPENREKEIMKFLKSKAGDLRRYIGSQIKTKFLPFLEFEIDEGNKNVKRIEELLEKAALPKNI